MTTPVAVEPSSTLPWLATLRSVRDGAVALDAIKTAGADITLLFEDGSRVDLTTPDPVLHELEAVLKLTRTTLVSVHPHVADPGADLTFHGGIWTLTLPTSGPLR